MDEVYDVFVDGVRIGTHGSWERTPTGKFPALRWFPIPETAGRGPLVHIAIRRWTGSTRTNFQYLSFSGSLTAPHAPEIGPADVIGLQQELRRASGLNAHVASLMVYALTLLVGLLSLALYLAQGRRENQWLGLVLLCEAAPLAGIAVSRSDLPVRAPVPAVMVGLQFIAPAVWQCFLASICPRFARPLRWLATVGGLFATGTVLSYVGMWPLPNGVYFAMQWASFLSAGAIAIALFAERRGGETALLAGALLLQAFGQIWHAQIATWLGVVDEARFLRWGGFVVDPRTVTRLIFAVTALTVLYRRHRREQERQTGVDRDLAQARLVQESLLGGRELAAPGYTVETAYLPASEVGGDFYREMAGPDGSLLVLVGDVSGARCSPWWAMSAGKA